MPRSSLARGAHRRLTLLAAGLASCGSGTPLPAAPETTVGAEVLQLSLVVSSTDLRPSDHLVVEVYATNPSPFHAVVRVDCRHFGLGLQLRRPSGLVEDVFTGIPPCKIPTLPPTLRVEAGAVASATYGWGAFTSGYPVGEYELQVVYRHLDGTKTGPIQALRFLSP